MAEITPPITDGVTVGPVVSVVPMDKGRADRRTLATATVCASFVITFLQAVLPQLQQQYPGVHWLPALSSGIGAVGTLWLSLQRNTDANSLQPAHYVAPGQVTAQGNTNTNDTANQ